MSMRLREALGTLEAGGSSPSPSFRWVVCWVDVLRVVKKENSIITMFFSILLRDFTV